MIFFPLTVDRQQLYDTVYEFLIVPALSRHLIYRPSVVWAVFAWVG